MTENTNPLPADIIELIEQVRLDSQIPWCIRASYYAIEPDTSRCYYCGEEIELDGRDYVTRDGISDSAQPRYHFHHWQRRPHPWQRLTEPEVAL